MVKKKCIAKRSSLTTTKVNNEKWFSHQLQESAKLPVISHTIESEFSRQC